MIKIGYEWLFVRNALVSVFLSLSDQLSSNANFMPILIEISFALQLHSSTCMCYFEATAKDERKKKRGTFMRSYYVHVCIQHAYISL